MQIPRVEIRGGHVCVKGGKPMLCPYSGGIEPCNIRCGAFWTERVDTRGWMDSKGKPYPFDRKGYAYISFYCCAMKAELGREYVWEEEEDEVCDSGGH